MYKSPIDIIYDQAINTTEDAVYNAILKVGVNVDKAELIKALAYDRGQYLQGYKDRDDQIVRCKDCIYWDKGHSEDCENSDSVCFHNGWCQPDWFCADGERRET